MKTEEEYKAEVLQLMRDLYPTLKGERKERAEHLFPELKESEGERIRREIIEYLEERDFDIEDTWIPWLRKQGTQEPVLSEEDIVVLDALIRRLEGEDLFVSTHLAVSCLKRLKEKVHPKEEQHEEDRNPLT